MRDETSALVAPSRELFNRLRPVAREIFTATFGRDFETAPFEAFCDGVYGPQGSMMRDFDDPSVEWQVATSRGEPIGYAKLTPLRAPFSDASAGALELQQLYVLQDWHGLGVADRLMEWALSAARQRGADEVYLTVFDHNERAKRFYARYGFAEVGRCTFTLGDLVDDDRIWRAQLRSGDPLPA
ncbi:GNAT superfamily N-acetyltransferase [Phenylobacterium haematophilum]|uniref:GNAT superfamily N-acetyltransferase n=1 Tax=Phenylobacterium haematophilum TaxID=98513 RepID=A0A839ZVU4_9CAUL|nr:GNAT family N-acetyltransferase [Phenylobacterium haematophilum]MBB3890615.1 GNAT superfamily N-acetyltransferase [Phenylobacterium haematophilum]